MLSILLELSKLRPGWFKDAQIRHVLNARTRRINEKLSRINEILDDLKDK